MRGNGKDGVRFLMAKISHKLSKENEGKANSLAIITLAMTMTKKYGF